MKALFKYIFLVSIVSVIIIGLNEKYPEHYEAVDSKVRDLLFVNRDNRIISKNVTIIDIDDESINRIGQWPWSRKTMAKLITNINVHAPSSIGLSIIFSEEDRTSPSNIIEGDPNAENYDEILASTIENSDIPIMLGYSFLGAQNNGENHETPYIPVVIKDKTTQNNLYVLDAPSMLLNIPIIQDSAYSSGFLNSITDNNGRITHMPLVMQYKDQYFPSLALELVRTIYSSREINFKDNALGNVVEFADVSIPVNENASVFVNYINPKSQFKHISAVDILNQNFNKFLIDDIANRIVLIGSNATGNSSLTPTPFGTKISGTSIQATIIENILTEKFLQSPPWEQNFNYSVTVIIAMIIISTVFFGGVLTNLMSSIILMVLSYLALQYLFDNEGMIIGSSYIVEANILALIVSIVTYFLQSKSDITDIKGKFASKVSKQVMDDLLDNSNKKGDKSSKRKVVTIFFSDIKSFTKITEKIDDPNKLTIFINRYMDAMTKSIMLKEGTVDKFMGDAIMAYWNAPYDIENHADKALSSAVEQIELLDEINQINLKEDMPLIEIRIGMTHGEAFVGEVGGELRSDYTVMGKNVNHAAVLEQVGKFYSANLIISQSVKDNLTEKFIMLLIDIIQVDGTSDAFNIYQVLGKGEANEFVQEEIEEFEKAITLYRRGKFKDSILIFRNLQFKEDAINSNLCDTYITRCEIEINNQSDNFSPIQSINKSLISGS